MKETAKMRKLYLEIQDKLFYMIPESFSRIYLYTSIIDQVRGMPIGEMYFYYFPKGIFKKKPVNVYEVPNKFNIDDEVYSKLINDLYNTIKKLRQETIDSGQRLWTNFTISIEDYKFSIEYHYDDLTQSPYSNYERHIIWRFKYLQTDLHSYNRKEQNLIKKYFQEEIPETGDVHEESVYANKRKNLIGYETDSGMQNETAKEEMIVETDRDIEEEPKEEKKIQEKKKTKEEQPQIEKKVKTKGKSKKKEQEIKYDEEEEKMEVNQILNVHN